MARIHTPPARTLPDRPDLHQLKRQAKELLDAFASGSPAAAAQVAAHFSGASASSFALHDAQLVIARSYGFDSWPKLKAFVDGATMRRLDDAVRRGDAATVESLLARRPELAGMGVDNHGTLHFAVVNRDLAMVRLLLHHGANAHEGVYPHRDATTPHQIALDRGYNEIVAAIEDEARRRREVRAGAGTPGLNAALIRTLAGAGDRAIAALSADRSLLHASDETGWRPLHIAAAAWNDEVVEWLLAHGADVAARGADGWSALDAAASRPGRTGPHGRRRFEAVVRRLRQAGAEMTERAAAALGDADWIRIRHAAAGLQPAGETRISGGLLRIAATHGQLEMAKLLLDLGYDPDERVRVGGIDEVAWSWGFPLWECAAIGRHDIAAILLERGADPNASVYASGTPVSQAIGQGDLQMLALLERYGGVAEASMAALHRLTDLAKRLFDASADRRAAAEGLLWGAACGGDPELVAIALEYLDWPRDDPRWFGMLEQPLRLWNHGPNHWAHLDWDRGAYLTCFRMILDRSDPNLRGRAQDGGLFGLTILHSVAGSREHVTPQERVAFAALLLDAGARLDLRDNILQSTPLGWACRWTRPELVRLFLDRGADPIEPEAESWATPRAWAEKGNDAEVVKLLRARR